jgi:ABC-2 type transport system ATP-binding protein
MVMSRLPDRAEIEVERLAKTYPGGTEAVRGISFTVPAGEVFGLLGPNGAGKSTTIGMLTTAIAPTAGRVFLAGLDVAAEPLRARRVSAVVGQDPAVDRALPGRRNLEIHSRLWGARRAGTRIAEVTDAFGLGEIIDRPAGSYSGGQRRRLEIARALLSRPRILFLDEPTVGLDPRIRHELLDLIGGLAASGDMTVLLTTHYLDEAERLCDRIAIMHKGTIAGLDSPGSLLRSLGEQVIEVRTDGDPAAAIAALRSAGLAGPDAFSVGQTLTVPVPDGSAAAALARVTALGLPGARIGTRPPTLDDVYLSLTGDRLAA